VFCQIALAESGISPELFFLARVGVSLLTILSGIAPMSWRKMELNIKSQGNSSRELSLKRTKSRKNGKKEKASPLS